MIALEDWAEIRRLHRAEGVPIKEIGRGVRILAEAVMSQGQLLDELSAAGLTAEVGQLGVVRAVRA
ncbi:hypothetical protein [Solwaraspora sp. WMMA2065]|uniref:hypothetical protein n=1 Tax=Solwaraspora sp. WMMA2065 TaxID=3015166 RepID=UPI00259B2BC6|nr:hypothetical protein [Solwaraspora sp. WMMA2065]WJK38035.1 hypothetical protein O7610_08385 [Solwaraspora sp. WMMA2065]